MLLKKSFYNTLSALFLAVSFCSAQDFKPNKRYYSIGGSINAMNYVGDLDPSSNLIAPALKYTRPSIGIVGMMRYSPRVSFRGTFGWGMIQGNDRKSQNPSGENSRTRYIRGANFRSSIFELKADVVVDFFENRGKYNKRPDFTPYGFVGIAGFFRTISAEYNGQRKSLLSMPIEGQNLSPFGVVIPFGLGFRYKLARQLDLSFEIGWRKTFTKYLDGVGSSYSKPTTDQTINLFNDPSLVGYDPKYGPTNQEVIKAIDSGNPPVDQNGTYAPAGFGREGDKRGEGTKDWYIVTGFHLTYIPMVHVRCPKFL